MFTDGLKLMITGMGTVFIFLALMIFVINFLSRILAPYASMFEPRKNDSQISNIPKASVAEVNDKTLISAIIAAVHKFCEKRYK